ncbi:hypothetical protein ZWY2020_025783, partial [Hordeum vulgare]
YIVLAPWVAHTLHLVTSKGWRQVDLGYILILPAIILRVLHNQAWITLSRFQTARGKRRLSTAVSSSSRSTVSTTGSYQGVAMDCINFACNEGESNSNTDDQIILSAILMLLGVMYMPGAQNLPLWRTDGAVLMALLHAGPVEFLYYWFHRALHHHFLYKRYHSHHHASIVTEPVTSVIHPFAEVLAYQVLFAIPMTICELSGTASIVPFFIYMTYIDFMNNMGHCNFELVPHWLFKCIPLLKYLMYTPSFPFSSPYSIRTNYSLFMPFYDYIYNTMDKMVCLTHLGLAVHLSHKAGLAQYASSLMLQCGNYGSCGLCHGPPWSSTWVYGSWFTVERNVMKNLSIQLWVIPDTISMKGTRVVTLGLLNQDTMFNPTGPEPQWKWRTLCAKYPKCRVRLVDGTSLAAAVVTNSIPHGTDQIVLAGSISKVARAVAAALCRKNVKIMNSLSPKIPADTAGNLLLSTTGTAKVWVIGEGLDVAEQLRAPERTRFIPYSQFPPRTIRKDCYTYSTTPAMGLPKTLQNVHSCEFWYVK